MAVKICTKCKQEKPDNSEYFHLDRGKTVAACKICKNKAKLQYNRDRYKLKGKEESKKYYAKHREKRLLYWKRPDVVEKRRKRVMENYHKKPEIFYERRKKVIQKHKEKYAERQKVFDKKRIDELSETYVLQLMTNYFGITRKQAREDKVLFETYLAHLKLKRLCRA